MDLKKKSKVTGKLSHRQELLLSKLKLFYNKKEIETLLPIINGETKLSLRIIDWFVTNYTKKNNILIYNKTKKPVLNNSNNSNKIEQKTKKTKYEYIELPFNIYLNYKSQLKAYSKKNFDPFCRRERINFYYSNKNFIVTTIGQLNFFKWAIENKILDYINKHLEIIDKDMNKNIKREEEEKVKKSKKKSIKESNDKDIELESLDLKKEVDKKRRKRRELSCSANNNLNKHNFSITLEFN